MEGIFPDDSFWHQPLTAEAPLATEHPHWSRMLAAGCAGAGLHVNLDARTIPVHEVDATTPRVRMERRFEPVRDAVLPLDDESIKGESIEGESIEGEWLLAHMAARTRRGHTWWLHADFGPVVPLPSSALPDGRLNAHLCLMERATDWAWEMWSGHRSALLHDKGESKDIH